MQSETDGSADQTSAPMRLSVLFPTFKLGGAELSQLDVLKKLSAKGWAIDILTFHPDGPIATHVPADMTLVDLGGENNFARIFNLAQWIRRNRPPIAFAFEQRANIILMLAISVSDFLRRRDKTRTVLCQRFPLSFKRRKTLVLPYLRSAVENMFYRRADRVVAISEGLRQDIHLETGRPLGRIDLIRNPKIDEKFLARYDAPLGQDLHPWILDAAASETGRPLVVSCGVLEARKNHAWLIDRFSAVAAKTEARLVIIGDGDLRKSLAEKISGMGLEDRVALVGFIENPLPVFKVADLVVHCSVAEGLSNIFVEALACNTPVLGLERQHGIAEVLEGGRWGRIVSDSAPRIFEEQFLTAIDASHQDRKWLETQDKGLERFDSRGNVGLYDTMLRGLLQEGRTDREMMSKGAA